MDCFGEHRTLILLHIPLLSPHAHCTLIVYAMGKCTPWPNPPQGKTKTLKVPRRWGDNNREGRAMPYYLYHHGDELNSCDIRKGDL